MSEFEGTYIVITDEQDSDSKKTKIWNIYAMGSENSRLGWIQWQPHWRRYAFYPGEDTYYEEKCLREIADFCEVRTIEHWKKAQTVK